MTFSEKLKHYQTSIEESIHYWVPSAQTRPSQLHSAMRYSLEAGGKRLRPVLLLAANDLFTSKVDPHPAAVSIECVHTYSLIHDDLPCMDNSPLRRGKPSCHVAYDEATALLAGDALLTLAFEIIAQHYKNVPQLGLFLTQELSIAAGSQKLIGGQMEDLLAQTSSAQSLDNSKKPLVDIDYIHLNKTAAMISCALRMGGALCTEDTTILDALGTLGKKLGLAFQIMDDILDETSTAEILGKTAQLDVRNQKLSYTQLHGIEKAKEKVNSLTAKAIELCKNLGPNSDFLQELIKTTAERKF